ncbi:rod shape-determining protein RodA [Flexistipes sinusarabici]|uniref:rod shape-determining protein RodA n=1 Tax=Flexistipes sinusarabici TaxID=2352 RepID=UPI002353CBA3|nr:rod shape-determining protein RodA [Flexistipes sinusarabici]
MFQIDKRHVVNFDYILFSQTVLLLFLGIMAIYSASYNLQLQQSGDYYLKQITWSVIGIAFFLAFSFVSYKRLISWASLIYTLGVISLVYVLIFGDVNMGAKRWIDIGGFSLQPSEFFKVAWVITLGRVFKDIGMKNFSFFPILKKFIPAVPPLLLIFLQPDLGTAVIFLAVWGIVLLYRGITKYTFFAIVAILLVSIPVIWANMHDYQRQRVVTFLNPEADPFGAGYHVIQSKIAVGSGGLTGKGYLQGTQSHLKFLPEKHTDFIFSVIGEEFGLVGAAVILLCFLSLLARILFISAYSKEPTAKIMCVAVFAFIFFQFFVNASMVVGMMPVVGIPMPFISYGGSSLVTFMSMLGIVNSIAMRRYDRPADL